MLRLVYALLGLLLVLVTCQCANFSRNVATEDVPNQTPSADHLDVGHVAFVRGAESWVLISLDKGVKLPSAARVQAKSSSGELAQLKLTQQKSAGYQAAEILSGTPRHGDVVIMTYPKGDGTDPEDQLSLDDIPPLLKRQAPVASLESALPASLPEEDPIPLPPEDAFPPTDPPSVLVDQPVEIRTKGIEPRAPTREADPLDLPDWSPPDDGETFMQELPQP